MSADSAPGMPERAAKGDAMPDQTAVIAQPKAPISLSGRILKLARGLSMMAVWIALVFLGAGRLDWARGWICTAVYLLAVMTVGVLVRRFNPGLTEARDHWVRADIPKFDRVFLGFYLPLTFIQMVAGGVDAVRFRALPMPEWTLLPGIALFLASMALICWTLVVNRFAESTVRIQSDRGHKVVSTGPYALVRHPMYAGMLLMSPGTAMMLGSGWAMLIAGAMAALLVYRTAKEDEFLRRELPGYREFASETRFRLLPGVW
jgi:protein-S-isoprenylcysteine O-methyltransferase Ste14